MIIGQITLSNVPDAGMITILEAIEAEGALDFVKGTSILPLANSGSGPGSGKDVLNEVAISWGNTSSLKALGNLLVSLSSIS
jgi:hypothetical protein